MDTASQPYVGYGNDATMSCSFHSYIVVSAVTADNGYRPDAPQISLKLEDVSPVPGQLSLTTPYWITFKLARKRLDHINACIFRWTPRQAFLNSEMVLLRLTDQGSERVQLEPLANQDGTYKDRLEVTVPDESVQELRTSSEIKFTTTLPMHYQKYLKAGERYQLYWPGGEFDMWNWGVLRQYAGRSLASRQDSVPQLPKLIVPASEPIIFTAVEESEPWPERPPTPSEQDFQIANEDELRWRNTRNPPPLSPALSPADHV